MNINEYKDKVIDLFQHGNSSVEQWQKKGNSIQE